MYLNWWLFLYVILQGPTWTQMYTNLECVVFARLPEAKILHGLPREALIRPDGSVLNTCTSAALEEMLLFLKRAFWPYPWTTGAEDSGSGFAGAVKVLFNLNNHVFTKTFMLTEWLCLFLCAQYIYRKMQERHFVGGYYVSGQYTIDIPKKLHLCYIKWQSEPWYRISLSIGDVVWFWIATIQEAWSLYILYSQS